MEQNGFKVEKINTAIPFTQIFKKLVLKNLKDWKVLGQYIELKNLMPNNTDLDFTIILISNILFATVFQKHFGNHNENKSPKKSYFVGPCHV